jgi:LysR family transcriptional regulator, low CO2-responsive transcriptional regulator
MNQATLHQLNILEAIARHGSFTRAAEELGLTQPTVSQQIKQLTKAMGLPLFDQIGKRIHLTEAGESVLVASRDIADRVAQLEMHLSDLQGMEKGRLRLSTTTTAKYFVPRLLGPFHQQHPGITLSLEITNQAEVMQRLSNNQDDLYFTGRPPRDMDVELRPILPNPLVVIANRSHPLAGQKNIPLKQLSDQPMIMRESGSGTRAIVEQFFTDNRLELKPIIDLTSNEAIKQAIVGNLGISVLSQHTLALENNESPLVILDVEGFPIQQYWYLVYPSGKQLSVAAQAFIDFILDEGKKTIEETLSNTLQKIL